MKLTIPRMVGILVVVMAGAIVAWEVVERAALDEPLPAKLGVMTLLRGVSTAVLMTVVTVLLMLRYRRRYEGQLRLQSEEAHRMRVLYENIIQDAGEAIISLDNQGIIRTWNRAAEKIYGYAAAEAIGRSYMRLIPQDLAAAGEPARLDAAVRTSGFIRNFETRRITKTGAAIAVRITRSALRDSAGAVVGSSAIVSDVTAEKEMERRLIQSEKLAAIGQAAASTAHEVRNALAGIWGTIQVLEHTPAWRQLPDGVDREVQLQLSRIAQIMDDLLSYARPGRLDRRRSDIHSIIGRALATAGALPEAEGKSVALSYGPGELFADVDPLKIEQAFHNLAANAFQAMGPGGALKVATRLSGADAEILFTDDGCGMASETLARALEPFFTTKARGTGLGLPIVRTIVEAHRGTILLISSPRGGTTVTVRIPRAAVSEAALPRAGAA